MSGRSLLRGWLSELDCGAIEEEEKDGSSKRTTHAYQATQASIPTECISMVCTVRTSVLVSIHMPNTIYE